MKTKEELIKEIRRLIILNDFTIYNAKEIGDFVKEKLETNDEWSKRLRDKPELYEEFIEKLKGEKLT